jgi:hypothetical protein
MQSISRVCIPIIHGHVCRFWMMYCPLHLPCMYLRFLTFIWVTYIPMKLSCCSPESGKAFQNKWHCRAMQERNWLGWRIQRPWIGENETWPWELWPFQELSAEHGTDTTYCLQVNWLGKNTPLPGALISLILHQQWTCRPEGWIHETCLLSVALMNSSLCSLRPSHHSVHEFILVVEITLAHLSNHFITSSHPQFVEEKAEWMDMISCSSSYEVSLWSAPGGILWHVHFSRSMLQSEYSDVF